nr:poly [ADP-ribose] polymerase 9 isoform X1 [Cavia porcellus]XP_013001836.1 poly [ADP-ribose] polymerase 9 isoform X1 [Cavia porcellus]
MAFSMGAGAAVSNEEPAADLAVKSVSHQIPINHNDFIILKNLESQLCKVLLAKFGCTSTLISPGLERNSQPLAQQVFRKRLTCGTVLSVWKDDLTRHAVDAVVNAANEDLVHGGGLAGALVKAGGYEIQLESSEIVATFGRVPTGEIAVTGAGRLPCRLIIHAVGPRWKSVDSQGCVNKLQEVTFRILHYVTYENTDIKTVAIPALSSGVFQFPLHLCTSTIVENIKLFLQSKQAGNLKEIHLVSNEDCTVASFKAASKTILGKNELGRRMSPETTPPVNIQTVQSLSLQIGPGRVEQQMTFSAEMEKKSEMPSFNSHSGPHQWTREKQRENGLTDGSPGISLKGFDKEDMYEAEAWIRKILTPQDHYIIENNHILYLGKKEHEFLSDVQTTSSVCILEVISPEKATLDIKGARTDCIEVVLNIECMLCEVQEEIARKKEQGLRSLSGQWIDEQGKPQDEMDQKKILSLRSPVFFPSQELQDQKKRFEKCGLQVIKVEKVKNVVLMNAFQRMKKMMEGRPCRDPVSRRLFQQVPRQFCNLVCRVGFQRLYSEPCDPEYGAGIYFIGSLKKLAEQVKKNPATDKWIYVFEAEVLTGSFCQGRQRNFVPLPPRPGTIGGYDSMVDNVSSPETFVIFSGTQAMPQYLWTCIQDHAGSKEYSSGRGEFHISLSQFSGGSSVD